MMPMWVDVGRTQDNLVARNGTSASALTPCMRACYWWVQRNAVRAREGNRQLHELECARPPPLRAAAAASPSLPFHLHFTSISLPFHLLAIPFALARPQFPCPPRACFGGFSVPGWHRGRLDQHMYILGYRCWYIVRRPSKGLHVLWPSSRVPCACIFVLEVLTDLPPRMLDAQALRLL